VGFFLGVRSSRSLTVLNGQNVVNGRLDTHNERRHHVCFSS
jgi:hypothetical protein